MLLAIPDVKNDYLSKMALAHPGTPEDIGAAVNFLLSDDARWITGTILDVDGGHHLRGGPDIDRVVGLRASQEFIDTVGLHQ